MRQVPKPRTISLIDLHNLKDSSAKANAIRTVEELKKNNKSYSIILDKHLKTVYVQSD
jgi:hypothetical protein